MDARALSAAAAALGVELTATQLEALALFEKRLYMANATHNLTSVPKDDCWSRHFLDSLVLAPLIPKGSALLDIGSGPGIPGAVIAIARPDVEVTCLDSGGKPVGFMQSIFGPQGDLPVLFQIVHGRAETFARDGRFNERFDVVTGRAVAPLPIQAELSAAFVRVGGAFIPLRTAKERDDVIRVPWGRLGLKLTDLKTVSVPPLGADRLLPVLRKQGRTPPEYPRSWALMKSQPLGE